MSDRTGRAMGTLSPIIFFDNESGEIVLPPNTADAKYIYERVWKARGYNWREAATLSDVDKLQKRLVAQETAKFEKQLEFHQATREAIRRHTASNLYARLASAGTTDYEKEFIRAWLELRDDSKRDKYRQALEHHNMYLYVREFNDKSTATDRIKSDPNEVWRNDG